MVILGSKYQRIVDNKRSYVLRVNKVIKKDNDESIVFLIDETHKTTMKTTESKLKKDYIFIVADAMMNIMYTKDESKDPQNPIYDMFVCVNKSTNVSNGSNEPCIVARQNIYSTSKNFMNTSNKHFVGDCFNGNSLPDSNSHLSDLFEFTSIEETWQICMYLDDTLDVLKYLGEQRKEIDDKFKSIRQANTNKFIYGYSDSLNSFLEDNNFLMHYRYIFNIMQIDFSIDIGNYDEDGNIVLNSKQQKRLEDILFKKIANIKILKYDKDIDVSKIVSYTHNIVSDDTGKIYLIAYTIVADFAVDSDILNHVNLSDK